MSDLDLHELLSAYLDDEVTPEERARVEEWLASSVEARRELDELRSLSCLLRESVVANAPSDLVASVLLRTAEDPPGMPVSHAPADSAAPVPHRPRDEARGWIVTGISLLITAAALLLVLRGLSPTVPVGPAGSSDEALAKTERIGSAEVAARDGKDRSGNDLAAVAPEADARVATSDDEGRDVAGGKSAVDGLAKKGFADAQAEPATRRALSASRDQNPKPPASTVAGLSAPTPRSSVPADAPQPSGTAGEFGGAGSADKNGRARQSAADRDGTGSVALAGSLGVVELAEGLQAGDVLPYLDGAAVVELTVIDVRRSYGELQLLLAKQGIELAQAGTGADGNAAPAREGQGTARRNLAPPGGPALGSAAAPSAAPALVVAPGATVPAAPNAPPALDRGVRNQAEPVVERAKSKDAAGPQLVAVLVQAPEAALAGILEQLEQDELVADLRLLDGTFVAVPEGREQVLALKETANDADALRTADAAPHAGYAAATDVTAPRGGRPKAAELKVAGAPSAASSRNGDAAGEGGASKKQESETVTAAQPTGAGNRLGDPQAARSVGRPAPSASPSQQAAAPDYAARSRFGEWIQRRNAAQNVQSARRGANAGDDRSAAKGGSRSETEAAAAATPPNAPNTPNALRGGGNVPAPAKQLELQQNLADGRSGPASNAFRMPLNEPEPSPAEERRLTGQRNVQSRIVEKTDAARSAPTAPKSETPAEPRHDDVADRKARGQSLPADDPTLVRMIFVLRTSSETDRAEPAAAVPSEAPAAK